MESYEVVYGDENIQFFIERKNIKNINLKVRPDSSVRVTADEKVPVDFIKSFVKSKARWILNNKAYFNKVKVEERSDKEFVSGESIKYLGRQYRLKVIEDDKEEVKYFRGYIYLYTKDKEDISKKKKLFEKWINIKCEIIFGKVFDDMYNKIYKYGILKPTVKIRTMKSRWGSCVIDKQLIILNRELIKAPKYCIEYVVLHELVHLIYNEHNNEFYHFLSSIMPDWKERKRILDEEVIMEL